MKTRLEMHAREWPPGHNHEYSYRSTHLER